MKILFAILVILIIVLIAFLLTKVKVAIEFATLESENLLRVKVYAFSIVKLFHLSRHIKNEKKSLKDKIGMAIDYFFKNRADPVEYAHKKAKESPNVPDIIKKLDIKKMFVEKLNLLVCLDLNNAAVSAISTGAANAIIGMVLAKYEDNIKCDPECNIYPGYNGDGIKIKAFVKINIKAYELLKMLLK